jgi:integrase
LLANRNTAEAASVALTDALTQAGQALVTAGQAVLAAASALGGQPACFRPVASLSRTPALLTVTELVNEYLRGKARAGRSDRYLRQLKTSLKSFACGRHSVACDQVLAGEIEKWIYGQGWAAKTSRSYLNDVKGLYNWAMRRGYCERSPALGVELPVLDGHGTIAVHTPDQVKQVLAIARNADLDVCRHLAVRYFTGIRSAECHRLREADIKLEQNLIEVPAVKSKTRARRLVTIQPNLRAWLALGGELRAIGDMTVRRVIKLSKVPWPHNVARHSFVSYHLAQFQAANKTALEAGHSEQMLFAHYRALVTPSAAAEFWSIVPG